MQQTLGLRLGIISNVPPDMSTDDVRAMLRSAGLLAFFDNAAIVTSRDAGANKPDPKIYEYAAQRIGVPLDQCLYVGEEPDQVTGAQEAGMAGLLKPVPPP